jgi:hypothetical protein
MEELCDFAVRHMPGVDAWWLPKAIATLSAVCQLQDACSVTQSQRCGMSNADQLGMITGGWVEEPLTGRWLLLVKSANWWPCYVAVVRWP